MGRPTLLGCASWCLKSSANHGLAMTPTGYGRNLARWHSVSVGFSPLEEIRDLWPGNPCLLMVKPLLQAHQLRGRDG